MNYHAFRGEHGPAHMLFATRLGSLSFGSEQAAYTYATEPNRDADTLINPRVIEATLSIKNPIMDEPDDPFIDLSRLIEALGFERTRKIALAHEGDIMETDYWHEHYDEDFEGVRELLQSRPEELKNLYCCAFSVLDDENVIQALLANGYDGAIHSGNGVTALDVEYKVFSVDQINVLNVFEAEDFLASHLHRDTTRKLRACT